MKHMYRFTILQNGEDTGDTVRAEGRDEKDARFKAANDPDLLPNEAPGDCVWIDGVFLSREETE